MQKQFPQNSVPTQFIRSKGESLSPASYYSPPSTYHLPLFPDIPTHLSRDITCTDHVALMH